jgi:cell division FtsZ-interacting protein ZapD
MDKPTAQSKSQRLILKMVKAINQNGIDAEMQNTDRAIFDGGCISYSQEESIIWVHFYTDQPHSNICQVMLALAPIKGWLVLDVPMYIPEFRSQAAPLFGVEAVVEYARDMLQLLDCLPCEQATGTIH